MFHVKKYLVSGRVQGVGYRWFVNTEANNLGLQGYVRNLSDGRVEVIAKGTSEQLENLEMRLRQGPSFARVLDIQIVDYELPSKINGFSIR